MAEGRRLRRRDLLRAGAAGLVLAAAGCVRGGDRLDETGGGAEATADRRDHAERARGTGSGPRSERPATGDDEPNLEAPTDGDEAGPAEPVELEEVDPADYPRQAAEWGERVTGVRRRLDTDEPVVALTFDACGGSGGNGVDTDLIEFLVAEAVPATLFVNGRWIDANPGVFDELVAEPLFEIANHGTDHRPLSVEGRSAYGIAGTASPEEAIAEIAGAQRQIAESTGLAPRHFRSGTAHYDDVAVRIVRDLGLECVNYDVLGDAGASLPAEQVAAQLRTASAGSIALLHMNHPGSGTAEGVARAVPELRDRGLELVRLGERPLAGG